MTILPVTGEQLKHDELAETLRTLADEIENRDALVFGVQTGTQVDNADAARATLEVEYATENRELYEPLSFREVRSDD